LNEPDCGVKAAVETGKISEFRYVNYLVMMEEDPGKYR
jgi:putative ribosome biogenesis GTPase RsgA